ncbi:hypothetical protein [Microbacterium sp. No. 7]|uniref:hypothetical protein n=1 Tax=Microbacterium sp. No. 7 TaxID=1714373 RepID=UPI0006D1DF1E|nr:hypothetical protein [Microbacterium sp. No. 7]ALJ18506.1 hypothetical protein AOA12_00675 [Microbacterium sp. No. 7]
MTGECIIRMKQGRTDAGDATRTRRWTRLVTQVVGIEAALILGLAVVVLVNLENGLGASPFEFVSDVAILGLPFVVLVAMSWMRVVARTAEESNRVVSLTLTAAALFAVAGGVLVGLFEAFRQANPFAALLPGTLAALAGVWCGAISQPWVAVMERRRWVAIATGVAVTLVVGAGLVRLVLRASGLLHG